MEQSTASDEAADAGAPPEPSQDNAATAVHRTFRVSELLEFILARLPFRDIARLEAVCTQWRDLIRSSPTLKQLCFFTPQTPNLTITINRTKSDFEHDKYYYSLSNDDSIRMYQSGKDLDLIVGKCDREGKSYETDTIKPSMEMRWNPIIKSRVELHYCRRIQPITEDVFGADLRPLFEAQDMTTWRWKDSLVCDPPAKTVAYIWGARDESGVIRYVHNEKGVTLLDVYSCYQNAVSDSSRAEACYEKEVSLILEEKHWHWSFCHADVVEG